MNEPTLMTRHRYLAARRDCVGRQIPKHISQDLREKIQEVRGMSFDEGYQQAIDEREAEILSMIDEAIEWA